MREKGSDKRENLLRTNTKECRVRMDKKLQKGEDREERDVFHGNSKVI